MRRCEKRRQDQLAQLGRTILTGQMAEDAIHVRSDFLIGRQIAWIVYRRAVRTL